MDLKIDAKFLGESVTEKIVQQAQQVIVNEVSPVTSKFEVYNHIFTAEMSPNDLLALPGVVLTPGMRVVSLTAMFDTDYPNPIPIADYNGANVGNFTIIGIDTSAGEHTYGSVGMGSIFTSFRPLLYTPALSEQIKLRCDNYQTTIALTGHNIRVIVEYTTEA
jgi:hypothetical protein